MAYIISHQPRRVTSREQHNYSIIRTELYLVHTVVQIIVCASLTKVQSRLKMGFVSARTPRLTAITGGIWSTLLLATGSQGKLAAQTPSKHPGHKP